jgi:hypothetical protein
MVTFNVDSLDFVDDEEARFGADTDFATRFDSTNTRLELEDLTNATVGYVPQNVGTDLVGGKLAETVSEGKALADDGNVYDTIQDAENAASSWVKIGPGTFNGPITVDTPQITISGSGDRTKIVGTGNPLIALDANDITFRDLSVQCNNTSISAIRAGDSATTDGVEVRNIRIERANQAIGYFSSSTDGVIANCTVENTAGFNFFRADGGHLVINNKISDVEGIGMNLDNEDSLLRDMVVANNIITDVTGDGIEMKTADSIILANRISDCGSFGVQLGGSSVDNIVGNNRLSRCTDGGVNDGGTGNVLDANLTT